MAISRWHADSGISLENGGKRQHKLKAAAGASKTHVKNFHNIIRAMNGNSVEAVGWVAGINNAK